MTDPLTRSELNRLVQLMREAFAFRADQKAKDPLAQYIQNPKITPFLSESLAVHLLAQGGLIPGLRNLRLGGRDEADVMAINRNGQSMAIEIKGTGSGAWVYLSDKDYVADYLLWIFFDDFFGNSGKQTIRIYLIRPHEIPERRTRITLRTLTKLLGDNFNLFEINLDDFLELV